MLDFIVSPLGGLLLKVLAVIALAVAVMLAWHRYVALPYERKGAAPVEAAWDLDKAARAKATADIESERDAAKDKAEKATQERDHANELRQAEAKARAKALPPSVASNHFPGVAVRVLNDAIGDSSAPTGRATKPDATTAGPADDSNVGAVTEWGVAVIALYETCRAKVTGWREFYADLLAAQPEQAK